MKRVLLAVVLSGLSFTPAWADGCPQPEFVASRGYLWSDYPAAVASADFNGDGFPDVAVANFTTNVVSVALNNGDGTLGTNVNFRAIDFATLIFAADMTGDAQPDLVLASAGLGGMSALVSKGDGSFQTNFNLPFGGVGVAIGDIRGNGTNDIATVSRSAVNVYLNRGSLSFSNTLGGFSLSGVSASSVALADLNADGQLDLLVGGQGTRSNLVAFLGNGTGSFGTNLLSSAATTNTSLAVADFDGDGTNDVATLDSTHGVIAVSHGRGDGTFQLLGTHATGNTGPVFSSIRALDLNNDGKPDLVVGHYQTFVLLGNGNGTFQPPVKYIEGGIGVAPGDFNGDGVADLAVTLTGLTNWPNVWLLPGHGDGAFGAPHYPTGAGPMKPVAGDFTGNGTPDIAVPNAATNTLSVLLNNGDGTYGTNVDYFCGAAPQKIAVGDYTGNGHLDLIVADLNDSNLRLLRGNGNGTFQPATVVTQLILGVGFVEAGDFTGDGKLDFAVPGLFGLQVFPGNNNGTFGAPITSSAASFLSFAATGSLRNNGTLDIVTAPFFGTNVIVLLGNGNGTFQPPRTNFAGNAIYDVVLGDVNADGKLDIITADLCANCGSAYPGGRLGVLRGNGDGTFQPVVFYPVNPAAGPYSVALADINGDGKPDLIAGNFSRSEIWVLLNNGDGTFQPGIPFAVGFGPGFVATADVMGDGHTDVLCANQTSRSISVLFNTCASNAPPSGITVGIAPTLKTNTVGASETIVAILLQNSIPVNGTINFSITSGPNAGSTNVTKSTVAGVANFTYTSNVAGADVIRAIGSAAGAAATTSVTRVWVAGSCPTITLSPESLPDGTVGVAYKQIITASGGAAPRTFAITTGNVPGLTLSGAGTLSGTPTTAGAFGFTITATDANDCTGSRSYLLTVNAGAPEIHNLALVKLKAPKKITFKSGVTTVTGKFAVSIQNRGAQNEVIPDFATLQTLVTVMVESLGECPDFPATMTLPKKTFPITLAPKKKLNLAFTASFTTECVHDPLPSPKSAPNPDYRSVAHVGLAGDADASDDECPRGASALDKGCPEAYTDVIVK
jgi:hypothetical protein